MLSDPFAFFYGWLVVCVMRENNSTSSSSLLQQQYGTRTPDCAILVLKYENEGRTQNSMVWLFSAQKHPSEESAPRTSSASSSSSSTCNRPKGLLFWYKSIGNQLGAAG